MVDPLHAAVSVEDLRDVDELSRQPEPLGAALLVHQAGHVRRDDVLGAGIVVVVRPCRSPSWPRPAPRRPKTCRRSRSIRRAARRHEVDALHLAAADRAASRRTVRRSPMLLPCAAARSEAQPLCRPTLCGNSAQGKACDLQHVVQELDQLVSIAPDLLRIRGLRDRVRCSRTWWAQLPDGADDVVEACEVRDEQRLGRGRVLLAAAVRHRLAAAGLVERIDDFEAKPFQQLAAWRCRPRERRHRHNRE